MQSVEAHTAMPLSYGVPEIGKSGFIETLQPQQAPTRRVVTEELGDFVSFDDLPPPPTTGHARGANLLGEATAERSTRGSSSSASAWGPSRRYAGASAALTLHEELLDFSHAFRPTLAERSARSDLLRRMVAVVQTIWPRARVEAFGSYQTGLYLPESDIDLVCTGTGVPAAQKLRGAALHRIAAAVRSADWPVSEMEVVDKAKVPIVKFVDGESGVSVDVCLEETSGLLSSELATRAARQFPAFGALTLFLKRFLNTRGLHDTFTGGVGSYLLQLLIIASLQHPPPDPYPSRPAAPPRGNLASALLHFLEVFGLRLNYATVGVSVRDGGRFYPKRSKAKQFGWDRRDHDRENELISVENPLDPSHDVGRNSFNIISVRRVLQHAYFALLSATQGDALGDAAGQTGRGWSSDEGGDSDGDGGGRATRRGRGRLQVLDCLLRDLEEEMASRFEVHAAEAVKARQGGEAEAAAAEAALGVGVAYGHKRKRAEADSEADVAAKAAKAGARAGAKAKATAAQAAAARAALAIGDDFVEDGDSDDDDDDDEDEEEEDGSGEDGGDGGGGIAIRQAGERKRRRDAGDVRAGGGKRAAQGGGMPARIPWEREGGGVGGGAFTTVSGAVHPREMTRKQRRASKKERRMERREARAEEAVEEARAAKRGRVEERNGGSGGGGGDSSSAATLEANMARSNGGREEGRAQGRAPGGKKKNPAEVNKAKNAKKAKAKKAKQEQTEASYPDSASSAITPSGRKKRLRKHANKKAKKKDTTRS